MKWIPIAFFLCLTMACQNNGDHEWPDATLKTLPCDSVLNLLVHSANIKEELKNQQFIEDGFDDGQLLIKIYHPNEAEEAAIFDAADGFLQIDTQNLKLFEVNIIDESLKEIKCDGRILEHYVSHCL